MRKEQKKRTPLMLCTQARGGMLSVVKAYDRDGLFGHWQFQWLWTHCEGSSVAKLTQGLKAYLRMLSLLIRSKVSFMHVHAAMRGSFWRKSFFIMTARLFGVPCILHLHGSEMKTFYGSLSPLGKRLVRWSLEHADIVIVLSDSWKVFISQAAPKANIRIINNYVSLPKQVIAKSNSTSFDVLFLGILGTRKGIYDLLASWPAVLKAVPHARLLIGGNGEVEKSKEMVRKLGINNSVQFLGWLDGERKALHLKSADAFVLPSYNEGLPMSVLEAMSYGKAVVTTRVGGIPELITHAVNGLLIEAGDCKGLSKALIKLGIDINFRLSIAAIGKQRIHDSFSDRVVLPKLEKLYSEISD